MSVAENMKNSVIPAIKDDENFEKALYSNTKVIFLLKSNLMTVEGYIKRAHEMGKMILLHFDLTEGLGKDDAGVKYVANILKPDGIITTKASVVKSAMAEGLFVVFRAFLMDGQGLSSAVLNAKKLMPDAVELMPGLLYDCVSEFLPFTETVILGGLLRTEESIRKALRSGASAVSCSNPELWEIANED